MLSRFERHQAASYGAAAVPSKTMCRQTLTTPTARSDFEISSPAGLSRLQQPLDQDRDCGPASRKTALALKTLDPLGAGRFPGASAALWIERGQELVGDLSPPAGNKPEQVPVAARNAMEKFEACVAAGRGERLVV